MKYSSLTAPAYRFRNDELSEIWFNNVISSHDLIGLEEQQKLINKNVEFLLKGGSALNILLWGEKGAGKSTVVRLLARDYSGKGLRIIEFCDDDYYSIYELYVFIRKNSEFKFILYFDDVSFNENDERYRNFKSIVEGGLESKPSNAIFVATSNRRHIMAESAADTEDMYNRDEQNESSSLFARFGLSIGFYPLSKEIYLEIVRHYFANTGMVLYEDWAIEAERFAIDRGGRSGRVAQQFAVYSHITRGDA